MCQVYRSTAKKGFWLAGLYNWVTILGLNQFFTSNVLAETDPLGSGLLLASTSI